MSHTSLPDAATIQALRSQALTKAWQLDPCADINIDGVLLLRRHCQLPAAALQQLEAMADRILPAARAALFAGEHVNRSENQPALHMALRAREPARYLHQQQATEVTATRQRMLHWADCLHQGHTPAGQHIRAIVHIGIGGSDLSPRLLQQALGLHTTSTPEIHYLSAPATDWPTLQQRLDPASTQVVVASKSLSTTETLHNWQLVRDWQQQMVPEIVVTAATDKALAMGVDAQHMLPIWPWVGGRYSFASAVSLSAAAAIGAAQFEALLAGAEAMDEHFLQQPMQRNLPVQLALLDFWNHCIRRFPARGVFTYHPALRLLSNWLQQLEMESNGKSVSNDGTALASPSGPLLFGGDGIQAQHAIFQLLHQGERDWPLQLIGVMPEPDNASMQMLFAQLLGQLQAFSAGSDYDGKASNPLSYIRGQRPVSALLLPQLDAYTIGGLLACHEHKTFTLGSMIGCNPFDQWGVEAGKLASKLISAALQGDDHSELPTATSELLHWLKQQ